MGYGYMVQRAVKIAPPSGTLQKLKNKSSPRLVEATSELYRRFLVDLKNHGGSLSTGGRVMTPHLMALLSRVANYDAEYGDRLSNHLPMALIALNRLGADEETLERFFHAYAGKLRPKSPPGAPLTQVTWTAHRGHHAHHGALAAFFSDELNRLGAGELLRIYLPHLLPGIGGAAFHGLIRTAYGLDINAPAEIIEGLAHWADTYLPLGGSIGDTESSRPKALLTALRAETGFRPLPKTSPTIFERMATVAADPTFDRYTAKISLSAAELPSIAEIALGAYIATRDFTALHFVTATHALRLILPFTSAEVAVSHFWIAFMAAYVSIGCPDPLPPATPADIPPWPELLGKVIQSLNDHAIKLAYTCREEERHYSNPGYRQAVALLV